ncbi:hypothetical protein A1359_13865 [Methylomonas lenta]|uniref:Uncharacterized protein n=1 Tax=Methylomonas lenta TaxID=980561 RepID=A0A177N2V8_9GAMM|nr:hypothetical protein [Methylomonas lenta]OAI12212.1 hypothetical protein A1359_13865 [Methylomonas lenta]
MARQLQKLTDAGIRLSVVVSDLSDCHRFVIQELMAHLEELDARILRFRQTLFGHLSPYQTILQNLQTIPGIDEFSAAMILVEIGDDMR